MNPGALMSQSARPRSSAMAVGFRILAAFDTIALLFAAALHVDGVRIALGSAVFNEPQIVPAAIVEGLAGLIFAVATYALFTGKRWTWTMLLIAHIFAILGFVLGIVSTLNGTSPFNRDYHLVMLAIFVIGLALLLTPAARATLRRNPSSAA